MRVRYDIEDGYMGPDAPQYVEISDDDLIDCDTPEERAQLISDEVQFHFDQNVYPYWDNSQLADWEDEHQKELEEKDLEIEDEVE